MWGEKSFLFLCLLSSIGAIAGDALPLPIVSVSHFGEHGAIQDITLDRDHFCAVFKSAIKCFGSNRFGQGVETPHFNGAARITSGRYHNCVIDREALWCWGDNSVGQILVPIEAEDAKEVAADEFTTCAITRGDRLMCWGERAYESRPLKNPRRLAINSENRCVITDEGVECSREEASFQLPVTGASYVELYKESICARDTQGMKCYYAIQPKNGIEVRPSRFKPPVDADRVYYGSMFACYQKETTLECMSGAKSFRYPSLLENVETVEAHNRRLCVLFTTGSAACWGDRFPRSGRPRER